MLYLLRLILLVVVIGVTGIAARGDDLGGDVKSALARGREMAKQIALPDKAVVAEGMKAAEKAVKRFRSPEVQAEIERQKRECTATWSPPSSPAVQDTALGAGEKVYLFLSSSIPDATVHNYLADIARTNEPNLVPVMRGLVGGLGDMRESAGYFARILKKDPDCRDDLEHRQHCERFRTRVLFQPPLFARYGIDRVPALVYDNGDQVLLIRGDAALEYLLERIDREAHSKGLEHLVAQLRGVRTK